MLMRSPRNYDSR